MSPKIYSSEGFVLTRRSYGESDRMIRLFTKDFGKITLLAKGVRKPKSRKRGSIEVFSRLKFSASKSKTFDILTEVLPLDIYPEIRTSLKNTSLAYYFMEIVDKITQEGEKHTVVYDYLSEYLDNITLTNNLKKLRIEFIYRILTSLGFWPLGKRLEKADEVLEGVLERKINSARVGKELFR